MRSAAHTLRALTFIKTSWGPTVIGLPGRRTETPLLVQALQVTGRYRRTGKGCGRRGLDEPPPIMSNSHIKFCFREEIAMSRSMMTAVAGCALLLLAAASPAPAVTVSALPVRPVEQTPFTLVVGGTASCQALDSIKIEHRTVVVKLLLNLCPTPPQPFLLEIPAPPLAQGAWTFQVSGDKNLAWLLVNVDPAPFELDFDRPTPQPGSPFNVILRGSASCPAFNGLVRQDGNLITLGFVANCLNFIQPPPEPFVIKTEVKPLAAGDYVLQAIDELTLTRASRRLHISDPHECQPSETALCLLQGRYRVEAAWRSEEHTSELQSLRHLVCRLLLE